MVRSKYDNVGADTRDSFTALSNSSDHVHSFLGQSSGRRGDSSLATATVLADSWLSKPMKERRSVWLAGVGKFAMVCVMAGLM